MSNTYIVKKGHVFHINPSKYYREDESFDADGINIKGQEYKLVKVIPEQEEVEVDVKMMTKRDINNRAIKKANNRGI